MCSLKECPSEAFSVGETSNEFLVSFRKIEINRTRLLKPMAPKRPVATRVAATRTVPKKKSTNSSPAIQTYYTVTGSNQQPAMNQVHAADPVPVFSIPQTTYESGTVNGYGSDSVYCKWCLSYYTAR